MTDFDKRQAKYRKRLVEGAELRQIREALGYSRQSDFAKLLTRATGKKVAPCTVSEWERGATNMRPGVLEIARSLLPAKAGK